MNWPVLLLLSCALALLACSSPASRLYVNAATYEEYHNLYGGGNSSCLSHNLNNFFTTALSGVVSGTCSRVSGTTLYHIRLTCTVGGDVTVEYFFSADTTCTGDHLYSSRSLSDKTCSSLGDRWDTSYIYVDCAASTLPSSITANPNVTAIQHFSDSTCQTPETDGSGVVTYFYDPVTNVCAAPQTMGDSGEPYDALLYRGTYRQSSPAGIVSIAAIDSECTQWESLNFQPLDACTMTTLGDIYAGTAKTSYFRYTSGAATVTPPVAWPVAVGSNVQQLQCLDNACAENCVLISLQRTGLCVPSAPKSSGYNSYMTSLSADGLYEMVSFYSDVDCAQRVKVTARPIGISSSTTCSWGGYDYAAAPSGLADASLVQLPLPPLAHAYYHNRSRTQRSPTACVSSTLLKVSFMQTDTCIVETSYDNTYARYTHADGDVLYTAYEGACTSEERVKESHQVDACNHDAPYSTIGESFAFAHRSSHASRARFGTLAGWYSADPNDLDASQAYDTANSISAAAPCEQGALAAIAAATAAALVLVLAMGF